MDCISWQKIEWNIICAKDILLHGDSNCFLVPDS